MLSMCVEPRHGIWIGRIGGENCKAVQICSLYSFLYLFCLHFHFIQTTNLKYQLFCGCYPLRLQFRSEMVNPPKLKISIMGHSYDQSKFQTLMYIPPWSRNWWMVQIDNNPHIQLQKILACTKPLNFSPLDLLIIIIIIRKKMVGLWSRMDDIFS